jgi:hypothetical protein
MPPSHRPGVLGMAQQSQGVLRAAQVVRRTVLELRAHAGQRSSDPRALYPQVAPAKGAQEEWARDDGSPGTSSGGGTGSEEGIERWLGSSRHGRQPPSAPSRCRVPSCNKLLAHCTLYNQRLRCVGPRQRCSRVRLARWSEQC